MLEESNKKREKKIEKNSLWISGLFLRLGWPSLFSRVEKRGADYSALTLWLIVVPSAHTTVTR